MNNIKLLRAQAKLALLALDRVDRRLQFPIENYIDALENRVDELEAESAQPAVCWACGDKGIIRADGIAINCSICNPAIHQDQP